MNERFRPETDLQLELNGQPCRVVAHPGERLSDVLRDRLGLTGTKVGCNAGDCGACTVLLDGQQVCACLVAAGQAQGRRVTTVEGLAQRRRAVAAAAGLPRARRGPVRDLHAGHADGRGRYAGAPPRPQRGAGPRRPGRRAVPLHRLPQDRRGGAGCGARHGGLGAAAGGAGGGCARRQAGWRAEGDRQRALRRRHRTPGLPCGCASSARPMRAPASRWATSRRCERGTRDWSMCSRARDVPENSFGIFPQVKDQPVLAAGRVRFQGEAVLALVGEYAGGDGDRRGRAADRMAAGGAGAGHGPRAGFEHAAARVRPRQRADPRPGGQGRRGRGAGAGAVPGAGHVHDQLRRARLHRARGGLRRDDWAIASACSCARRRPTWIARRWRACSSCARTRCTSCPPRSAEASAASSTSRSSRCWRSRPGSSAARCAASTRGPESMLSTTKRHPARMQARFACDAEGRLLAADFFGDFNTGAYASWGNTVANRVPIHASGPYFVPNVRALTRAIYTNGPIAGAFRGFGVPQSTIVHEALLDDLAEQTGIDRLELRLRNAIRRRPGHRHRPGAGSERRTGPVPDRAQARLGAGAVRGGRVQRLPACARRIAARQPARGGHRLHVVRHRQYGDRQSVHHPRGPAPRRTRVPVQRRGGYRPGFQHHPAADLRGRTRPAGGLVRPGDGRHRPHRRRRQVLGVAPDLRVGQRRASRR